MKHSGVVFFYGLGVVSNGARSFQISHLLFAEYLINFGGADWGK